MAGRKAFIVNVELDVQAVTCPGVWLCSNGQVSLQIYMLDSCVQTSSLRPTFPMLFHEIFKFSKTLPSKFHLEDLNNQLSKEWLYVELVQWENCETGNVLAYFQRPLNELLYPTVESGVASGAEVDLLMEATLIFPGGIAPKLEVATKTTIEETICTCVPKTECLVNPKLIVSTCSDRPKGQKAVCHSPPSRIHRNKKCKANCYVKCKVYERPPWRYKRVEDGFLQRQRVLDLPIRPMPQLELDGGIDGGPYSKLRRYQPGKGMEIRKVLKEGIRKILGESITSPCRPNDQICTCSTGCHAEDACTVCQKYSGIFCNNKKGNQSKQVFYSTVDSSHSPFNQFMRQVTKYDNKEERNGKRKNFKCKAHNGHIGVSSIQCETPQQNVSVAKKLHDRISKTLQSIPRYFEDTCMDYGDYENEYGVCNCEELPDMKKFYKELYQEEYDDDEQN